MFTCPRPNCSYTSTWQGNVSRHLRQYHNEIFELHPCQQCGKKFKEKSTLKIHQEYHCPKNPQKKRVSCPLCDKPVTPSYYNKHIRSCSGRKDFHCYFCQGQRSFSTSPELEKHLRVFHTKERPFTCQYCPFRSSRSEARARHSDRTHSNGGELVMNRSTPCYFCGKKYPSFFLVSRHITWVHIIEKPYQCGKCSKRFPTSLVLRNHQGKGERSVVECPICLKMMIKKCLQPHIKRVHDKRVKTHKCPVCSRMFKEERNVQGHMKTHDPNREKFTCEECGVQLYSKGYMKKHKESHRVRAKISCSQCEAKVLPEVYNQHIRNVHGPPRYICYFCGKAFKSHVGLSVHLLSAHIKETMF